MDHYQAVLLVPTVGKNFYDLTNRIKEKVRNSGIATGLCTVFVRHTSASLVIQENADPDVLHDLSSFFSQLVPEDRLRYRHGTERIRRYASAYSISINQHFRTNSHHGWTINAWDLARDLSLGNTVSVTITERLLFILMGQVSKGIFLSSCAHKGNIFDNDHRIG